MISALVIFFLGNTIAIDAFELHGKIHKNVYIQDLDMWGLTKQEAKDKLNKKINNNSILKLTCEEKKYEVSLTDLKINYKIDEMIDEAYNVGRNKDIFSNIKTRIKLDMGEKYTVKINSSYEDKIIENYINYIEKEVNKEPINATIRMENEVLVVEKEEYGIRVEKDKLKEIINNKINEISFEEEKIPNIKIKPMHVYEELSKIDTVLGTYETIFNKNPSNRANNINVGASATSDILLSQYEEFSFNKYTSTPDVLSKFKEATVILNGHIEKGIGGGICQVSTTIYNAALYAGLEITDVRNHSIPSAYVEKGRDSTVSGVQLDLKFKNKFETPIYIYNKVVDNKIVSTIYGNKEDKKDIDIVTETIKTISNKTKVIENKDLYVGEEQVKEKGRLGYKVNTFRIYKNNNEPIKEFVYESYYPPMDKEIIIGIKEKEENKKQELHQNLNTEIL